MLLRDLFERQSELYLSRRVRNAQDIQDWMVEQGFPTSVRKTDMHVTVTYSKASLDWSKTDHRDDDLKAKGGKRTIEQFGDDAVVLTIESDELQERNGELKKIGAKSKFSDYRPHITLTYKLPKGFDLDAVEPYEGEIIFGPEIWQPIDKGWSEENTEVELK